MQINYSDLKEIIRNRIPPDPPYDIFYQPTCVFLLLFEKKETNILTIQKADNEGYPWRNQVALPGGHVDNNDLNAVEAAFRELKEEVNIERNQVDFIGSLGHFPTISHKDIEVFTGIWNGNGELSHDSHEISRIIEVPLTQLVQTHRAKRFHGRIPDIHELIYPLEDVAIWGATARILHYFIELLYPMLTKSH